MNLRFRALIAVVQQRCASSECALAVLHKHVVQKERFWHAQHNIAHCSASALALASVAEQ